MLPPWCNDIFFALDEEDPGSKPVEPGRGGHLQFCSFLIGKNSFVQRK